MVDDSVYEEEKRNVRKEKKRRTKIRKREEERTARNRRVSAARKSCFDTSGNCFGKLHNIDVNLFRKVEIARR